MTRPESVSLEGGTLRVVAGTPLPADEGTLAVAVAIGVFERFSALDAVVLATPTREERVSRSEAEGLLAPEGFAGLRDRQRRPRLLARAVQRRLGASGAGRVDGDGSPAVTGVPR